MRRPQTDGAKDTYLNLTARFPLRRLNSRREYAEALKVFNCLSLGNQSSPDVGVLDYLDVLAELVDQYERAAKLKVNVAMTSPASVVRHLLEANAISISALAREIGIGQSNLSDMLSGRRSFSKRAIASIRDRFGVSPEIFF